MGERENRKASYKEAALGASGKTPLERAEEDVDGNISDDDLIEESTDESWFGLRMTGQEKWEARRRW